MKNLLIVVLLIVIGVLAFLLAQNRSLNVTRVVNHRHDHNGNPVDTQDCPERIGKKKNVCVIPVSYLQDMVSGAIGDTAIEVRHKETILWFGDNGESLDVKPMTGVVCSDHSKPDPVPQPGQPSLIDDQAGSGSARYAHVNDNSKNDGYCYKTNITVTTASGVVTTIDPHLFDGGP
ncbi:MAG TPA: hypothetical protein VJT08_21775 [Terriglobales bacterium]|jgi:hypothetical protein|nr:hypothetical protein [Terriglobales bacterium]